MEFFNWEIYISNYPDLKKAGIKTQQQAFLHYTRFGLLEKRTDKVIPVIKLEPDVKLEPVKIVVKLEPVVEVVEVVEVEVVVKPEITFEFTPIDPTVVEMVKTINEKSKRKYNKKK